MKLFVRLTGIATFLVLGVLAVIFYKERILTLDVAFQQLSFILHDRLPAVSLRYAAIVPQLLPLLFRVFHCPLKEIMLVHSAGYVLFYFVFFFLIAFVLNEYWIALSYLLFLLLWVNDTFYWVPSEIPQGIAYLFLYYAWLQKRNSDLSGKYWPLHFLVILFIQYLHPLLAAPILFVILYKVYDQKGAQIKAYFLPVTLVLVAFGIRYYFGTLDWYEGPKMNLGQQLHDNLSQFFKLASTRKIIHYGTTDYLVYWLVFTVTMVALLRSKNFFLLTLLGFFTFAYLAEVCIGNSLADKFYLENMLLPLSVFVLLPFTDYVLKQLEEQRTALAVTVWAIITIRLFFIYDSHTLYTNRLNWYSQQLNSMEKNHTPRLIISDKQTPNDTLLMNWATPFETLLLSSIDGPEHTKAMVITDDTAQAKTNMDRDTVFIYNAPGKLSEEVKRYYFHLPEGKFAIQQ